MEVAVLIFTAFTCRGEREI